MKNTMHEVRDYDESIEQVISQPIDEQEVAEKQKTLQQEKNQAEKKQKYQKEKLMEDLEGDEEKEQSLDNQEQQVLEIDTSKNISLRSRIRSFFGFKSSSQKSDAEKVWCKQDFDLNETLYRIKKRSGDQEKSQMHLKAMGITAKTEKEKARYQEYLAGIVPEYTLHSEG